MPLFLMSSPLRALVEGSNVPTMISDRMALITGWRTAGGRRPDGPRTADVPEERELRAERKSESGNPGRAASTWWSSADAVLWVIDSLQRTE
jgi:hypothetical protein